MFQYRLTPEGTGTKLTLIHRGMGDIAKEHREGVSKGWEHICVSASKPALTR